MAMRSGVVTGVRVTHETASVEEIGAVGGGSQGDAVAALVAEGPVEEAYVLQTCNRAEAYVVTAGHDEGRAVLADYADDAPEEAVAYSTHEESLRHLLRVAAGLESVVLGEDQILGQVSTAYEDARGADGIGPVLEDAVTKAIRVGDRVRSETEINEGAVSLGSAAVELAAEEGELNDATALVVGAGEMATIAAKRLADRPIDGLVVANRTVSHAEYLADEAPVEASAVGLSAAPSAAESADVIVTATASDDRIFGPAALSEVGDTVVVDLGQPRDVAPAAADAAPIALYDLDDIEDVTDRTHQRRRAAVDAAEEIVEAELRRLLADYKRKRADEVIGAMYESADRVKQREVETAISKLEAAGDGELTDEQRAAVESMADALVNQLLAAPTKSLREAAAEDDWATIHTALQLFDPDLDEVPDPIASRAGKDVGGPDGPGEMLDGALDDPSDDTPAGPRDG